MSPVLLSNADATSAKAMLAESSNAQDVKNEVDAVYDEAIKLPNGTRTLILGVHRVIYTPDPPLSFSIPGKDFFGRFKTISETLPSVRWLFGQLHELGSVSYASSLVLELLLTVQPTLNHVLTNRIMNLIEVGFKTSQMDARMISLTFGARTLSTFVSLVMGHVKGELDTRMEDRAALHFRYLSLQAKLARAFADGPDADDRDHDRSFNVWGTTRNLVRYMSTAVSAISESIFLYKLLSTVKGNWLSPIFFLVLAIRVLPVFQSEVSRLWRQGFASHVVNSDFLRMISIRKIATDKKYSQEVLGLNLGPYLLGEYRNRERRLADVTFSPVWRLMGKGTFNPFESLLRLMADEIPTLYYIFSAIFGWPTFSFSTISSVQTASRTIVWRYQSLLGGGHSESLPKTLTEIHDYHTSIQLPGNPDDEADPYPVPNACSPAGMAVEFRDVSFTYKGSKSQRPAIASLSCSIRPGQLVVIVGANGSGKTSLTKLLTRLYEPTSGTVLVDGRPAKSFKLRDLRQATATLSQDHQLFEGLSIAENISIGRWECADSEALVEDALRLGGARDFVKKMTSGNDTVLHPTETKDYWGLTPGNKLLDVYDQLEKASDVSGGEKQRLVAARTFMRMNTGAIRLVVVDEPSAAMDPAGEYELFKHLREARQGKTMIFITHRFGHLTKHADLILCMKDGKLVEQGTHAELVAKKGEYFELYNVQAQAFVADTQSGSSSPETEST